MSVEHPIPGMVRLTSELRELFTRELGAISARVATELGAISARINTREDTLLLAIAELKKQNIELTDRVSRLEHARAEDVQRIDAHGLFIRLFFKWARLP